MKSVWNGRDSLTDDLERDYAAMKGDGWELIYEPPSPLTTPWSDYAHLFREPEPEREITMSKRDFLVQKEAHELRNEIAIQFELDRQVMANRVLPQRKRTRRGLRMK